MTTILTARRAAAAAAVSASVLAAVPAVAGAHTIYPTEGRTSLALSASAKQALSSLGISASGTAYAVSGGVYSFHALDDGGGGTLRHSGSLTLRKGATRVRLSDFVVKVKPAKAHGSHEGHGDDHGGASGTLSATVAGKRLTVATLDLKRYKPAEEPPGFAGAVVALSAPGAAALDAAFSTSAFATGLKLGTLRSTKVAQPLDITGGETKVVLDPKAVAAITGAGASLTPLPGTAGAGSAASPLTFPVVASRLDYVSFAGNFLHTGGLKLTAPAGKTIGGAAALDLGDFSIASEKEGFVLRAGGATGTPLFRVLFGKRTKLEGRPAISLSNTELYLTKDAAALLAPALGVSAKTLEKLKIGTASLRATYRTASS